MSWAEFTLKSIIQRDKNDPSVIMWSLGNEIQEGAGYKDYAPKAPEIIKWAQEVNNTKPLTKGKIDTSKKDWEIIIFDAPINAKFIKFIGVETGQDNEKNKHMAVAEIRVIK